MKNFALIGAAGYIADRHMKAIKDTGNNLIAALDKSDSVGMIDNYFPHADFFTEYERFDRHIDKLKRTGNAVDFMSICTPNYLHDAHIRFSLKSGADAICEKPLVLNPWNVDSLGELENETGKKVYNILQLRLHPSIIALKEKIDKEPADKIHDIDLTYITARGNWYFASWKAFNEKSGGIHTNIGIHFFDMLIWIFGDVKECIVNVLEPKRAAGVLHLNKARVRWYLSLEYNVIPDEAKAAGKRTYRVLKINDEEFEFSEGFTDLHTLSYKNILAGNGFGLNEARPSIELVYQIRNAMPIGSKGDYHPFILKDVELHPFYKK
jgi:UDP-N-acetyl-2-amino-2-deoxyglucuronate dehydrogenase